MDFKKRWSAFVDGVKTLFTGKNSGFSVSAGSFRELPIQSGVIRNEHAFDIDDLALTKASLNKQNVYSGQVLPFDLNVLNAITTLMRPAGRRLAKWLSDEVKQSPEATRELREAITKFQSSEVEEGLAHTLKGLSVVVPSSVLDTKLWSLIGSMSGKNIDAEGTVRSISKFRDMTIDQITSKMKGGMQAAFHGNTHSGVNIYSQVVNGIAATFPKLLTNLVDGNGEELANALSGGAVAMGSLMAISDIQANAVRQLRANTIMKDMEEVKNFLVESQRGKQGLAPAFAG